MTTKISLNLVREYYVISTVHVSKVWKARPRRGFCQKSQKNAEQSRQKKQRACVASSWETFKEKYRVTSSWETFKETIGDENTWENDQAGQVCQHEMEGTSRGRGAWRILEKWILRTPSWILARRREKSSGGSSRNDPPWKTLDEPGPGLGQRASSSSECLGEGFKKDK